MSEINWGQLGFGYVKTNCNARCEFHDGKWGEVTLTTDETIPMHIAATCLHYGQEAFEGLKVFRGVDGKARFFRIEENARRMINSAAYLKMEAPSEELFIKTCEEAVKANAEFLPPYGTGASLYVRPLLLGITAEVGVKASKDYLFVVFVTPVGPYFKNGFAPIDVVIERDHDRAAPRGTGHTKVGGNYAASINAGAAAHEKGYANELYLDAAEQKYVDEFGAANFFGIKDGKYVTPNSRTVLPSITNKSLRTLAQDLGLVVEDRPIPYEEIKTFEETGACGTAAVISPVGNIYDPKYDVTFHYDAPGKVSTQLFTMLQDIQYGRIEDKHGWTREIDI